MGALSSSTLNQSVKHQFDKSFRCGNLRLVQNTLLIWLDRNIDEKNRDCQNTINHLRHVVNSINKYTNVDDCIRFLQTIGDEKACLIISGSLGQEILPQIHQLSQVDSIFIFCNNKKTHENWSKNWPKIKGVFTDISLICQELKHTAQQCEHNSTSISFMKTDKTTDHLDVTFMYTQIFKEIFLSIHFEKEHTKEFIRFCREQFADNEFELVQIKKFQQKYSSKTSIWWYTNHCFLYPMLNRALRTMDVDIIIKMGFFITDLHRHLEQLHTQQFNRNKSQELFTVYRGQGLSKNDFQKMLKTNGGLLSFNNFLSTSKNYDIASEFAHNAFKNPDLIGIIFAMKIEPNKSTTPFACIHGLSVYPSEDEILFSMHTVFRIEHIQSIEKTTNRLYQVDLRLTDDNDQDLCRLTEQMREETKGPSGWYRLGELLRKIGEFEQAQQMFINILNRRITDREKALVYNQLGLIKNIQGEFLEAITLYQRSLEILTQNLPPNDLQFATIYENLGLVYCNKKDYPNAVSSHLKALDIRSQILSSNHPDLAASFNNIGVIYAQKGDFEKALSNFEKAHAIQEKSLPSNHPGLAKSYDNIGNVYSDMRSYSKALRAHEKAVEIFQRSLPSNHPDLGMSYNNLGVVHENLAHWSQARSYYQRAVDIGEVSLPSDHSEYRKWKKNLENIQRKF